MMTWNMRIKLYEAIVDDWLGFMPRASQYLRIGFILAGIMALFYLRIVSDPVVPFTKPPHFQPTVGVCYDSVPDLNSSSPTYGQTIQVPAPCNGRQPLKTYEGYEKPQELQEEQ